MDRRNPVTSYPYADLNKLDRSESFDAMRATFLQVQDSNAAYSTSYKPSPVEACGQIVNMTYDAGGSIVKPLQDVPKRTPEGLGIHVRNVGSPFVYQATPAVPSCEPCGQIVNMTYASGQAAMRKQS